MTESHSTENSGKDVCGTEAPDVAATGENTRHEAALHWFAARLNGIELPLERMLGRDGIRTYRTTFAPGILFLRCSAKYASDLISSFWGKIYFYLDPERKHPAPISEREMNNFILVTSASDDLIPLGEVTADFLQGERVRVTAGLFKGAEGVIRRIKGDRRLIVAIDNFAAVATCHIRPELLEKI